MKKIIKNNLISIIIAGINLTLGLIFSLSIMELLFVVFFPIVTIDKEKRKKIIYIFCSFFMSWVFLFFINFFIAFHSLITSPCSGIN